jgi:ribosomal protein S18 acetylase RimI-like enzyme
VKNCSFFAQGFLVLLVVHPNHRRRGIASALIRHVEGQCPTATLFTSTNRSNKAMQAVCKSLGFIESGVVENLDEGRSGAHLLQAAALRGSGGDDVTKRAAVGAWWRGAAARSL